MWKIINLTVVLCLIHISLPAGTIQVDGTWKIVTSDNAMAAEQYGAQLLSRVIGKRLNCRFKVTGETAWKRETPAIIIGDTVYMGEKLQRPMKFGPEEWYLEAHPDGNIMIGGGKPRGTLYAVYEFLERFAGYRHYAIGAELIPVRNELEIPADMKIQGKPFFRFRTLSEGVWGSAKHEEFQSHNRALYSDQAKYGFGRRFTGSPAQSHTFWLYSQDFPDNETLFSLDIHGRRLRAVNAHGPGQLCMTNREARRLVKEKLRSYIRRDREEADANPGMDYPVIYDISQNDNQHPCLCGECSKLGAAGALIDFINDIAADIAQDYPDVLIQTFAYMYSLNPPRNAAVHPNAMIRIASLGTEWSGVGTRETMRSLEHPGNAGELKLLNAWQRSAAKIHIWDYGTIYKDYFPSPYTFVRGQAVNIAKYASMNAEGVYLEAEVYGKCTAPQSFADLKNYLFLRLLIDPYQDAEAVIRDFMQGFYGPAAEPMLELLNYLEACQNAEPGGFNRKPVQARQYLNAGFFQHSLKLLAEAETLAAGQPEILQRIRQEYYPFDFAMLSLFDRPPSGGSRADILARLEKCAEEIRNKYLEEEYYRPDARISALREKDQQHFELLRNPVGMPEQFMKRKIVMDFTWNSFAPRPHIAVVEDAGAAGGRAACLDHTFRKLSKGNHDKPFEIGIYDNKQKKIIARIEWKPGDENYHWVKIPAVKLTPDIRMWAHWTWVLSPVNLEEAFNILEADTKYDIYFSVKLQGPAYIVGSTKNNAAYMDRVIVVESTK